MSTVSTLSNSSSVAYATSLAESAKLKRSLYNIGNAIDNGDLTKAESKLKAVFEEYPQYASSADTASDADSINSHFKAVSNAISNKDVDGARAAWATVKSDLQKAGIVLSEGSTDIAKLLAENKAAMNQSILDTMFGSSSGSDTVTTLLGSTTSSESDSISSLINNWVTYKSSGTTSKTTTESTLAKILDTSA